MSNCPATVNDYIPPVCFAVDKGRIVAIAFVDEGIDLNEPVDITDPAVWVDPTYTSDIIIHQEVNGAYPPSSPVEVEGKGKQATRSVGRNHEATVRLSAILGNDKHWNAMNRSTNYKFAFVTGEDYSILHWVDTFVDISAAEDVQSGTDTEIDWVVTIKWNDVDLPSTSAVPAGIFEP